MGHKIKEKVIGGDRPIFYRDVANVQSGFNLKSVFPVGTMLPKGTFIDFTEGENSGAYVVKSALVVAGGTDTAQRVEKRHLFQPGDEVFVGSVKAKISSIKTSELAYDILNLASALPAVAGDILREVGYAKVGETTVTIADKVITVPESQAIVVGALVRKQGMTDAPVKVATVATAEGVSTITLETAIAGLKNNDVLDVVELHETYEPMGCLYKPLIIEDDAETVDVVVDAKVYARRIQPVHPDWFGGNRKMFLKNNPGISFTYTL